MLSLLMTSFKCLKKNWESSFPSLSYPEKRYSLLPGQKANFKGNLIVPVVPCWDSHLSHQAYIKINYIYRFYGFYKFLICSCVLHIMHRQLLIFIDKLTLHSHLPKKIWEPRVESQLSNFIASLSDLEPPLLQQICNFSCLNWSKIAKPVSKLIMIWNSREQSNAPDQEAPRCYRWILNKFDIKLIIFKQALVPSHYMHWGLHYYFKISLSLLVTGMEHCTHSNKKGLYIGLLVIYHLELHHHSRGGWYNYQHKDSHQVNFMPFYT